MMGNQAKFEVIRDLITVLSSLKDGESVAISVLKQQGSSFYSWETSKGESHRSSELARALRETYEEFISKHQNDS